MAELSKLQIRAKVLSAVSEIKAADNFNKELADKINEELAQIEDKKALFDIFIKEYLKMNESEYIFTGYIITSLVPSEYLTDKIFEMLQSQSYTDDLKYKLVQLLRTADSSAAVDAIPQYFDNPEEVLDLETERLLEKARFNPEAMLDFLDFVYTVNNNDKTLLLESLKQDYNGDVLANIVYPILYSDFDENFKLLIIEILSDSKSSLALAPLNYIIDTSKNETLKKAAATALKKLKLAGAAEEKAEEFFKSTIQEMKPYEFYITIPDGSGNQALLSSRVTDDELYTFSAVVTNDKSGIVDCFGFFNISKAEFDKIIDKFFASGGKYKINPEYVKYKIDNAFELTKSLNKTFPYEFICWNVLLADIKAENYKENENKSNTDEIINSKDEITEELTKEYTYRWFITSNENTKLKELIDCIYNMEQININDVNELVKSYSDEIFDEKTSYLWKNKVEELVYILKYNDLKDSSLKFQQIIDNDDIFKLFKSIIIQRSIFNNFIIIKDKEKETSKPINIFRKKVTTESKYNIKKIEEITYILQKQWING